MTQESKQPRGVLLARILVSLQERLAQAVHTLLDALDQQLFDLAERSRTGSQQQLYFDSLRLLRRERVAVETHFLEGLDRALQGENGPEETPTPGRSRLRLVGKDEQEETLQLETRIQRTSSRLEPILAVLEQRWQAAFGELAGNQTPRAMRALTARSLSRRFRASLDRLDVPTEIRLVILGLFGAHVLTTWPEIVAAMSQALAEAGFLPELEAVAVPAPSSIGPGPQRIPRQIPEPGVAAATAPDPARTPQPDGNEQRILELQQLLAQQHNYVRDPGARQAVAGAAATARVLPARAIIQALERFWDFDDEPGLLKRALLESAARMAGLDHGRLAADDEDVIDVISLLFSHIRRDPDVPEPMQGLLACMHVPFLHVALNDPGVLRAATHPARELLDELGALAVGWCPSADPDATSLKRISAIVTGLTRRSADKVSTSFDQALHELQRVIAARRRRIELAEQRAIESVIGHERLMLARSRVSTILDEELRDCEPVPWVRQLLRGPWAHHLVLTWLRHDESSSTFRAARDFVTALVWADSPPEQGARARHLAQLHAALPEQLRQGLTGITLHESEIARLVNQLEIFLACCLRGDDWPDFLFEIDPSLAGSEAMADWNEAAALDGPVPAQVDPLLLERLQDLPADTWVEFRDGPAARPERGRLCWTSPYTRRSLFVNWNGARLRHMPLHELALALKSGQTRLIDGSRLVARTLRALIQELRTSLATRPSS